MVRYGLWVRIEAKPGKEDEVAKFLASALPLAEAEEGTLSWYAIRMGPNVFGVFDTFNDDDARKAHLEGRIAAALKAKASELLAKPPSIEKIDLLAAKEPGAHP